MVAFHALTPFLLFTVQQESADDQEHNGIYMKSLQY
mgnify:CR=1 FL=1